MQQALLDSDLSALWTAVRTIATDTPEYQALVPWMGRIRLALENGSIVASLADDSLADLFTPTLRQLLDRAIRISRPESGAEAVPASAPIAPRALNTVAEPQQDILLDDLLVGTSNRLALAAGRELIRHKSPIYNPFVVHANSGLGKTLLLHAILRSYRDQHPERSSAFYRCETFLSLISESNDSSVQELASLDLLIVDDLHRLGANPDLHARLVHLLDSMRSRGKQIVFSTLVHPSNLSSLSRDLSSRLRWGLVLEMESPTAAMRESFILKHATVHGLRLEEPVVRFLCEHSHLNFRELEGVLTRIFTHMTLLQQEVTLHMIQNLVQPTGSTPMVSKKAITVADIHQVISTFFGLEKEDLLSRSRARSVAYPRQIGMYMAKQLTSASLEEIGKYFGGRDHSTVKHGCEKIQKLMETDRSVRQILQQCESKLMNEEC